MSPLPRSVQSVLAKKLTYCPQWERGGNGAPNLRSRKKKDSLQRGRLFGVCVFSRPLQLTSPVGRSFKTERPPDRLLLPVRGFAGFDRRGNSIAEGTKFARM